MSKASCPHCAVTFKCKPELAGRTVTCPKCQGKFTIPIPQAVAIPEGPGISVSKSDLEPSPSKGKGHVVTELTAKRYKLIQMIGVVLLLVGIVKVIVDIGASDGDSLAGSGISSPMALSMTLLGLIVWIVGRMLAWWHHG